MLDWGGSSGEGWWWWWWWWCLERGGKVAWTGGMEVGLRRVVVVLLLPLVLQREDSHVARTCYARRF